MSKINFKSPATGIVKPISAFPDDVIADKAMGDGLTIELTGNEIVAPFKGEVNVMFPTGHAICLTSDDGVKLMIHVGADTYAIKGLNKGYVNVGDYVEEGDLLITTDVDALKEKVGSSDIAIVFLNNEKVVSIKENLEAKGLDEIAEIEVAG